MQPQRAASAAHDAAAAAADDDDDDYMNMVFTDAQTAPETSLQRRQRERREAALRGRVKSKAELAAEEASKREAGLATSLLSNPKAVKKSKGFAMMAKMGFNPGSALGRQQEPPPRAAVGEEGGAHVSSGAADGDPSLDPGGLLEPVRISVKGGRGGIGLDSERKRKRDADEAPNEAAAENGAKCAKPDGGEFRDRVRREREVARKERQLHAAQKVAERMSEDEDQSLAASTAPAPASRPLQSINVLWRGLVRAREVEERDRRMRYDLQQGLSLLPTYEDEDEDEDDRKALGKAQNTHVTAEDLDEDDVELEEFNSRDVNDRLQDVVNHLRKRHNYCFWCKYAYPDEQLEGCPGKTEEDHD